MISADRTLLGGQAETRRRTWGEWRAGEGSEPASLARAMARFSPGLPLAVAFSGGADSTALLLACAEKWPGQVQALHVHHGLQAAADDFERHCRDVCGGLGVPLAVRRVWAQPAPGQSPEQAARAARYAAFSEHFRPLAQVDEAFPAIKDVAIAHHADDQVETPAAGAVARRRAARSGRDAGALAGG